MTRAVLTPAGRVVHPAPNGKAESVPGQRVEGISYFLFVQGLALPMQFAIVMPDPAQWVHVRAFDEVADAIQAGCSSWAIPANAVRAGCWTTALISCSGRISCRPSQALMRALSCSTSNRSFREHYGHSGLRRTAPPLPRLDYSVRNIAALEDMGIHDATHVPLGYAKVLERIPTVKEDIDVLFYGAYNERRMAPCAGSLSAAGK